MGVSTELIPFSPCENILTHTTSRLPVVLIRIWSHRTSTRVCFFGNDRSSHSRIWTSLDPMSVYYEWASDSFAYLCPCNNSWYVRASPRVKKERGGSEKSAVVNEPKPLENWLGKESVRHKEEHMCMMSVWYYKETFVESRKYIMLSYSGLCQRRKIHCNRTTSYCSLFFLVLWTSIYNYLVQKLIWMLNIVWQENRDMIVVGRSPCVLS